MVLLWSTASQKEHNFRYKEYVKMLKLGGLIFLMGHMSTLVIVLYFQGAKVWMYKTHDQESEDMS